MAVARGVGASVLRGDAEKRRSRRIIGGSPVKKLLYDQTESKTYARVDDLDFYQKQFRVVLRNCGVIDPEEIDEYIARDGYAALEKVLFESAQLASKCQPFELGEGKNGIRIKMVDETSRATGSRWATRRPT